MTSNNYTSDKAMAISKKINEIRGILKELDNEDSTFLTESFDYCNEYLDNLEDEILPYYQSPMPKLEDGMFGIRISIDQCGRPNPNSLTPFVVIGDSLIYQSGGHDFANPERLRYSKIIRLYDAKNFDCVKKFFWIEQFNNVIDEHEVWRDNSYRGEYKFFDEVDNERYVNDDDMED